MADPPNSICLLRLSAIGDHLPRRAAGAHAAAMRGPRPGSTWVIGRNEIPADALDDRSPSLSSSTAVHVAQPATVSGPRSLGRRFDVLLQSAGPRARHLYSLLIRAPLRFGLDRAEPGAQWLFTNRRIAAAHASTLAGDVSRISPGRLASPNRSCAGICRCRTTRVPGPSRTFPRAIAPWWSAPAPANRRATGCRPLRRP